MNRRTGIILALCLGAQVTSLRAQTVYLGAQLGATQGRIDQTIFGPDFGWRTGVAAGASLAVEFGALGLQVEGLYIERGARRPGQFDMRIGYLELPVLARFRVPLAPGLSASAVGGIAWAREVNCELFHNYMGSGGAGGVPPLPEQDCSDMRTTGLDHSVVAGVALEHAAARQRLGIELRYYHGAADLADQCGGCRAYHRSVALLARYAVPVARFGPD